VRDHGLGEVFLSPVDCILSATTVLQPDIVLVATAEAGVVSERAIEGAPTLAAEVLSSSTRQVDRGRKLDLYRRHGVRHVWVVDPDTRTIDAFTLGGGAYAPVAQLAGDRGAALPPFDRLVISPTAVWA
jgi:Uma2 family endonuclease